MPRSLAEWLNWQESLHPRSIELGLDRSREVARRLDLRPPPGRVFTVAGTNGKGTTAHFLAALMTASGWRPGLYTSPHLVRYNERIRLGGAMVADEALLGAFEAVEAARRDAPLTYFEFGTLAALWLFSQAGLDAWILEVGLGGRLDAVNIVDPDFSLITTVARDHEAWLGESVEVIAREKAGILRGGRPGFFGGHVVPDAVTAHAAAIGAPLHVAGQDFSAARRGQVWQWTAGAASLRDLPLPEPGDAAQLANLALAMAAAAACSSELTARAHVLAALDASGPPGRFQQLEGHARRWVLDVAHNPQAAQSLAAKLDNLPSVADVTVVLGLHANKDRAGFLAPLAHVARRWIACRAGSTAGLDAAELAAWLATEAPGQVLWRDAPRDACALAVARTGEGGRIVVCGSFEVVGPALDWLGWRPDP
jgi:dihydrofolate synthase/folylpolyglutamate synthase